MKNKSVQNILNTGINKVKNVSSFNFGFHSTENLINILEKKRIKTSSEKVVFFIDEYFKNNKQFLKSLRIQGTDKIFFINTTSEPTTSKIDEIKLQIINEGYENPSAIVAVGGGSTMDTGKAISNLLTNPGFAADYQGWDLVKNPGIFKIGIPTISGTGAEATRTCVMTNSENGLKLGMNSDFTVFDHIILDPYLTKTVPSNQYFYTGMDAYIHCIESLNGSFRNAVGDSYSRETLKLCREVFMSEQNMKSDINREKLMVASYLGGCAIASSYVGIIHPLSAALSVVLKVHHCIGNCIVMRAMEEFYPDAFSEFWEMVNIQNINIPKGICSKLTDNQFRNLIDSTVIHEKPLTNALGIDFRKILDDKKIIELFKKM